MNNALDYRIRVSVRAKRVQMKLNQFAELEVVIPKRFAKKDVSKYVKQHSDWIHRTRARILALRPEEDLLLPLIPEQVYLAAVDRRFRISNNDILSNEESHSGFLFIHKAIHIRIKFFEGFVWKSLARLVVIFPE